jgi:hypothetical protein
MVFLSNNKVLGILEGYHNINDIIKEYNGITILENILQRKYNELYNCGPKGCPIPKPPKPPQK